MMERKSPISVVLIGCGAVSQSFYLPTLQLLARAGEVVVVALVDSNEAARKILKDAFPEAEESDQMDSIGAPVDSLAIIATPVRLHAKQACEAMARGWHVLCEKPMATTVSDGEMMVASAEASQHLLAIGLYKRFFPSSRYIKALMESRRLGALLSFTIAEGGPFKWPAATPSFFDKAQTSGGVLLDIGVHVLDLLFWWLGDPNTFSYADDAMGGLETNVRLELHYPEGVSGTIHLSRDWATGNEYRLHFEHGVVSWCVNEANSLALQLNDMPFALRAELVSPLPGTPPSLWHPAETNPQSFIAQLKNVLSAIRNEETLLIPGDQGINALRLIENCYESRTLLRQPWFTPAESVRAEKLAISL